MKIIDLTSEQFSEIQTNFLSTSQDISFFSNGVFLQSLEWAEIQRSGGHQILLKKIENNEKIIGFFIVIEKVFFKKIKYWYIPRGPIIFQNSNWSWNDFFYSLGEVARQNNIIFIRFEPIKSDFSDFIKTNPRCIARTKDVQPSHTTFLDLSFNSDILIRDMAQKTRYNIRLAEKKGVQVIRAGIENFDDFWRLMSLTSKRDQFSIHSKEYYYNLIKNGNEFIRLYLAKLDDRVLAVGLFSFFSDTVSYLHGASDNSMRNVMAPYLLQWEVMKKAQKQGYKYYDFYGVDDKKWPGVSRFKRGFAGNDFSFLGTYDYIVNKKEYKLYKLIRNINLFIHHLWSR
jgi:lipid II:glycine glycyltransferase (peptidoglycan interpeptide bridge formation enzyme)